MKYWVLIMFIIKTIDPGATVKNNVCKTFGDYYLNPDHNKNCYFNPDEYLAEPDIIKRHGYPLEIHVVTTLDGYILSLFRIPYGRNSNESLNNNKPPIFIQHGLLTSSVDFYYRGNTSLAFILADEGYDVWMGNFRGVRYSNTHVSLHRSQPQYWNFSFHELGVYDLPAQLNYVKNNTGQKVVYIGVSMGTTAYFVYASLEPYSSSDTIRFSISLAPVAFLGHLRTPVKYLIPLWPLAEALLKLVSPGSLAERTPEFNYLLKTLCLPYPFQMKLCNLFLSLFFGIDPEQIDPEILPVVLTQLFDSTSIKSFTHYIQLYQNKGFKQFDYGINNIEAYGTPKPPDYPLSQVNVVNHLVVGRNDWLSTVKDVETLDAALPDAVTPFPIYFVKYDKFTHGDYITAKDVKPILYDGLVKFIDKYGTQFT